MNFFEQLLQRRVFRTKFEKNMSELVIFRAQIYIIIIYNVLILIIEQNYSFYFRIWTQDFQICVINIYIFYKPLKTYTGGQDRCSFSSLRSESYHDSHLWIAKFSFIYRSVLLTENVCFVADYISCRTATRSTSTSTRTTRWVPRGSRCLGGPWTCLAVLCTPSRPRRGYSPAPTTPTSCWTALTAPPQS